MVVKRNKTQYTIKTVDILLFIKRLGWFVFSVCLFDLSFSLNFSINKTLFNNLVWLKIEKWIKIVIKKEKEKRCSLSWRSRRQGRGGESSGEAGCIWAEGRTSGKQINRLSNSVLQAANSVFFYFEMEKCLLNCFAVK